MRDPIEGLEFVLGGARSGKSRFARGRARECPGEVLYLATAWGEDEEMRDRIRRHRRDRPDAWNTIEPPYDLLDVTRSRADEDDGVVLFDEFTLWLSDQHRNGRSEETILDRTRGWLEELTRVDSRWIVVSALANRGVVPATADARRFRDLLGLANQLLARRASRVVEVVAGIPRPLK